MFPNPSNVVTFDYTGWSARYPELAASVNSTLAQLYFNEAQLYCDNTPCGLVPNIAPAYQRQTFLNMLTAHIAALNAPLIVANTPQPSNPLVGRISNATEGSVSVTVQMDLPAGSAQWYAQTKYGIAYWQASSAFRTMHYVPGGPAWINPWRGPNNIVSR